MPRFFKPRGGFVDKPAKALRIEDDGDTFYVMNDGKDARVGYVSEDRRWMPAYSVPEVENLIAGGSWVEVPDADADIGAVPISPKAAPPWAAPPQGGSPVPAPSSDRPGGLPPSPTGAPPIKADDANKPAAATNKPE